jgi:hypothetical protein
MTNSLEMVLLLPLQPVDLQLFNQVQMDYQAPVPLIVEKSAELMATP